MPFEVSAAVFDSIIKSLRSDLTGGEHRQAPRVGVSGRVTIIPLGSGVERTPISAMVRDLSTRGIGLAHSIPLPIKSQLIVRFAPGFGEPARAMLAVITHSVVVDDNLYTSGVRFIKQLDLPSSEVPDEDPK